MIDQDHDLRDPAPIIDRAVARGLDLLIACLVFVAAYLPFVIVITVSALQSMFEAGDTDYTEAYIGTAVLASLAAVAWEPFRQIRKGTTFGRSTVKIQLRLQALPSRVPYGCRVFVRHMVTLGALTAVIGASFAALNAFQVDLTPWRVVGLVAASSALVWLSALLSTLFRADRRGWHDLVAGTMLVRASTSSAEFRSDRGLSPDPRTSVREASSRRRPWWAVKALNGFVRESGLRVNPVGRYE